MSGTSTVGRTHDDYKVALVFALPIEMWAFRYMLDKMHAGLPKEPGDPNHYCLGEACGHNVVLAWLPGEQGNSQASRVATNLSRTFKSISWRFLVGIGGGVNNKQHPIRLGDVVVSMPTLTYGGVAQYDLGRDKMEEFQRKGIIHAPPEDLRSIVAGMQEDLLGEDSQMMSFLDAMLKKDPAIAARYGRPPCDTDILFPDDVHHTASSDEPCRVVCDVAKAVEHESRDPVPKIWYGLIASGNSVMANTTSRADKIQRLGADVLCFEMEAAGVLTAFPCLVIRGIADYADSHKHKQWQPYAAAAAAACAKDILARISPSSVESEGAAGGTGRDASRLRLLGSSNHVEQGFISQGNGNISPNMTFNNHY